MAVPPLYETPEPRKWAGTYGKAVAAHAKAVFGIRLDPWQRHVVDATLRHDSRGQLLHSSALWSVARQNGKSVGVRAIVDWMLDEGWKLDAFSSWRELLAAAHDAPQARLTYRGVLGDLRSVPRFKASHRLTEYVGIEAPNGLAFNTVTSQPGSVRGHSAGLVAWDEVLTQRDHGMLEVLLPVTSAQPNPLMLYTSTAGFSDSVVLRDLYDDLVGQATGARRPDRAFYGAWWASADPDAGLDWDAVRQANPGTRIPRKAIENEFRRLPRTSWRRERLNHWVDAVADSAFGLQAWAACRSTGALAGVGAPFCLGVDVHPGWERATVAAAGLREDGRIGVEVVGDLRADAAPLTAERVIRAVHDFPEFISTAAYDARGAAASAFDRDALETGLPWEAMGNSAMIAACMDVSEMVMSGRIAADDPLLDAQVAWTSRREVGTDGAFRFSRPASGGPIDAVYAMTLAAHAMAYRGQGPTIT
jgi:hypothetical protein